MLISVQKHVVGCYYEETYVLDEGYLKIFSSQKFLIEKDQDEDTPGRDPRPDYLILGKYHVGYVDNFLTLRVQEPIAGNDGLGRK